MFAVFDPTLVEIVDVVLGDDLPFVLQKPTVDESQGRIRFAAGILGQTLTEPFTLATVSVKLKVETTGTMITLRPDGAMTDISGPNGSVLTETGDLQLKDSA